MEIFGTGFFFSFVPFPHEFTPPPEGVQLIKSDRNIENS